MKHLPLLAILLSGAMASHHALAETTPAKQALITKILKVQQKAIEGLARNIVEQPANIIAQQASAALQSRVAPEKRESIGKDIQSDLKKYVDEATPIVRERAIKLAPATLGKMLDEKFSEKELKELLAIFESPVNRKFHDNAPAMQRALGDALVAETRPLIEPKVRALEQRVGGLLGLPKPTPAAPTATPPAGK